MQAAIETFGLVRRFATTAVVDGIDLCVPIGSVFGFLGPNGAGKTTTIRLLLGLLAPTGGEIHVLGEPMPAARRSIARQVGALVETPAHYDQLTGIENLDITRRLLRLPAGEIDRALVVVGLQRDGKRRVGGYSLGMRQRLGIARALLGRPKLLLLDEPTNGLDPDGIRDMRELIRTLPESHGVTLFVSSHLLAEVEQMATHVALMARGRLLAQGPLAETLAAGPPTLEVEVDRTDEAAALLAQSGLAARVSGRRLDVTGAVEPAAVNFMLNAAGLSVSHLALRSPSLEERYLALTGPQGGLL